MLIEIVRQQSGRPRNFDGIVLGYDFLRDASLGKVKVRWRSGRMVQDTIL
jgi:hypothetical protein